VTDSISGTPTALRSFSFLVRRLPFSTVLVAAILATAAFTNTLAHPIPLAMLDRWGFGLEQIRDGRFYQLFLAPFQILRPYMAISIAGAVFLFVGACEYRLGTWRAVLAFWTGHIVGYVGAGVAIVALAHLGSGWAAQLMHVTDVGASNGAFGACGTVVLFLAGRARKTAFLLVSAFLAGALLIERRIWNIEHILAFCAGIGVGRIYLWQMRRHWPGLVPQWQIERRQRPIVVAWAVGLVGVVNVMGAFLTPVSRGWSRGCRSATCTGPGI
jgi:phosphatidylglycerol lysyltransferase